jgi:hypothetical protein
MPILNTGEKFGQHRSYLKRKESSYWRHHPGELSIYRIAAIGGVIQDHKTMPSFWHLAEE